MGPNCFSSWGPFLFPGGGGLKQTCPTPRRSISAFTAGGRISNSSYWREPGLRFSPEFVVLRFLESDLERNVADFHGSMKSRFYETAVL